MTRLAAAMKSWSFVAIAVLVLAGCAPQAGSIPSASATPAAVFDPTATVRMSHIPAPPRSWDPITASVVSQATYLSLVYDRLVVLKPDLTVGPMLATSWTFSADGKTLDLQLRRGVKFWDGAPFDAKAAQANLERARSSPDSTVKSELTIVSSVDVVDEATIRLRLKEPGYALLYNLAGGSGVSMMANPAVFGKPELQTAPFGSGPFKLVSATQDRVLYERWDGYWDPSAAKAARLEIHGIADDNARLNALRSGQLDLVNTRPGQYLEAKALADGGQFKFYSFPSPLMAVMFLNTKRPGLDKVEVRQALSLAIDRKAISDKLLNGQCKPNIQPFAPGVVGHDPKLEAEKTYDPQRAKQLLTAAGATNLTLEWVLAGAQPNDSISEAIQGQLAEVGVKVNFTKTTAAQAVATWGKGLHDAAVLSTSGSPDPSSLIDRYLVGPIYQVGGAPPALVSLAEAAKSLPLADPRRSEAFQKVSQYHVANPTHAFLCVSPQLWLANPSVLNVEEMGWSRISGVLEPRTIGMAKR